MAGQPWSARDSGGSAGSSQRRPRLPPPGAGCGVPPASARGWPSAARSPSQPGLPHGRTGTHVGPSPCIPPSFLPVPRPAALLPGTACACRGPVRTCLLPQSRPPALAACLGGTLPCGAGAGVLTWAWPEALFGHLVAPGGLAGGTASGVGMGWGWSRCGAQNLRLWAFLSRGAQGPGWRHLSPGCAGAHTHTELTSLVTPSAVRPGP